MTQTTISRRGFSLGLGAATLALRGVERRGTAQDAEPELSGHVVATRRGADDEEQPRLTVVDLRPGGRTVELEAPVVTHLFPVPGTARAVATTEEAVLVVDAAAGTATEVQAPAGGALPAELSDLHPTFTAPPSFTDRFAVFADRAMPRWLIDLREATAVDLIDRFAGDDPFFQVAAFAAGDVLVLASGDRVLVVDPTTALVERDLVEGGRLAIPQLAPGGDRVGWVARRGDEGAPASLIVAGVGGGEPAIAHEDRSGTLGFRWISDDAALLLPLTEGRDLVLARLDLASGDQMGLGTIRGWESYPQVLAEGTRAITETEADDGSSRWRLTDLDGGETVDPPDLAGTEPTYPLDRATRAVLFQPEGSGTGVEGADYHVLNTATAAVRSLLTQVDGQFYPRPTLSPDRRSAALSMTGREGEALWLCDLVRGETVRLDGYLGAEFAPDSRAVLTRKVGRDNPLEILDLDGSLVRELDVYNRAWWIG